MKRLLILPAMLFVLFTTGQADWKQALRYRIEVKLDDKQQSLEAKMNLDYANHSPDTLHYIWFHVWPNAYRNDKTSYSEQLLENGKTNFYFSDKEQRGYLNRLEFRINGALSAVEDHPEYIDVVKLILPQALNPGDSLQISATFHVKLPHNFSGSGYLGHNDQVSNWYPEPAVYDRKGWHAMPFLEQGGAYHETADYAVRIEVPPKYVLVANCSPDSVIKAEHDFSRYYYSMQQVNSFAWLADKRLLEKKDFVQLDGGKQIALHLYYFPQEEQLMEKQRSQVKPLLQQISRLISDYPYRSLSIMETHRPQEENFSGMIQLDEKALHEIPEEALRKALLAQWFQAICASDQRTNAWMSRGFIDYYNRRLEAGFNKKEDTRSALKDSRLWLMVVEKEKTAQPISTPSPELSPENYELIAGTKAGRWIKLLEDTLGREKFDRVMQAYFKRWAFSHPYPDNFQQVIDSVSGEKTDVLFHKINDNKPLIQPATKKTFRAAFLFSAAERNKYNYINFAPMAGYNRYDQFMAGAIIHNLNIPENNFQFLLAPLYATGSKSLEGLGRISYSWYPLKSFRKITVGINGSGFSSNYAKDSSGKTLFEEFSKIVPYLRIDFRKNSPRSTLEKWIELKTYLITEKNFSGYAYSSKDSLIHPNTRVSSFRYLNEWSVNMKDDRALYPYDARLELQQSDLFYRVNLNARYFFNYPAGGGMAIRFFAAKFGVWNVNNRQDLTRYEPKLLGNTGDEDYTYGAYFIGRSASTALENTSLSNGGLPAQQIMIRDGGLKLRLDPYGYVQGRSADWVTALNFSTSLPPKLFPFPIPLRIFFDLGTDSEAWQTNAQTSRFLYTGGLQLSLFKNILNIYAPLVYSSDFRNLLKGETFWNKLTFSIDIGNFDHKKLLKKIAEHG